MAFFIAWVGCWFPVALVLGIALNWQPNQPLSPKDKLPLLISLYILAPLIVWGISYLTQTNFSSYGLIGSVSILKSLLLGFGLAVLSLAVVFGLQLWLGWCNFQNVETRLIASLSPIVVIALFVGGIEELVFRGFLFTELKIDYPVWVAAVVSSLIFAVLHLVWEQKETIPQLPGLWLMGMVLVLAFVEDSGSIGLAWGLHAGWVWAIATLDTAQLINYTGKVPDWVTGKNNKPLAGVAGVVCLLLTAIIIWCSKYF
ncbi:CPBP family intramembrane metalloprotease [Iningainema sp. BLCCT55]|uniref:CPBP family intramembrane metalloprotease n=2 Tax=Iningainema TaxID=1932705 RepID=A0A8J7BW97_9CYAN|nr:type II CAAX endopeptidase family protein [Iningainema tapete]MBD2771452.1 CPBP family intramembrane metalloprotease [Iningainema tapete BLCC-T55]